jgi:hypothetical protein
LPQGNCDTHAQGQDDERVFTVISGLQSVIPLIEHIDERTHKADRQGNHTGYK